MNAIRSTVISILAAASLLPFAAPASAQISVGGSIGYPGGYGVPQPVQPLYGPPPAYVAPAPVYVPRPYHHHRDEGWAWREREERAAEWRYRHDRRPDYRRDYGHEYGHDNNWRNEANHGWRQDQRDGCDGHR